MADPRHRRGRRGELVALLLLILKGYRPRHRNWRGGGGELDLVVSRGRTIVFVEVKTRSGPGFGGGAAAIGPAKRHRLTRTASAYLSRFDLWDRPTRFDAITIEGRFPHLTVHHLKNAFRPDLGRRV
ncbi:MAG TPA: YraN family protein [Acidobacteria bacterium]|nr:YraN family protein [Acidobacteriota bacterium]